MEQLLNFIDIGFILTLGILILVSGAIMLYCYRRLNLLENSIIEHGKILQNFIINYNNQLLIGSSQNNMNILNHNENNENNENNELKKIDLEDKINISDNDDDNDDDDDDDDESDVDSIHSQKDEDSDEESDNDVQSDSDIDSEINKPLFVEKEELIKSIKIEEISDLNNNDGLNNKDNKDNDNDDNDDNDDNHNNHDNDDNDNDNGYLNNKDNSEFLTNLPINLNDLELNSNSRIINLESNDENNDEKKNYNKMKVDDLRALVVSKSLTDNDSSKNMKKNDLIKLLQNEN